MKNLPFAIWMLGWFPALELEDYLHFLSRGAVTVYSKGVQDSAALLAITIWLVVGGLLYRREA